MFVIHGNVVVNGTTLETRDSLGIWETKNFTMDVLDDAQVLVMEVPMTV